MDTLQNIIEFIEEDTDKQISSLKEKNDIECQQIISNAESIVKKENENNKLNIARKKEQILSQTETSNIIFKNKAILEKKHKLIDKTLEMSMTYFCNIGSKKYFTFFSKLISKNLPSEKFKLIVGFEDFLRIPTDFLKDKVLTVEYEKSDTFSHGFQIVSSKSIIDLSIQSIFNDNRDLLRAIVYNALNLGEIK